MITIATGTRADWGILRPLARRLTDMGADIEIAVTHAHLIPELGYTVSEIIADGFTPAVRVPAYGTPAEATAMALKGFGEYFTTRRPRYVVILGDRFEMLGVATAALLAGIPIAHIAGGTVSEGAFDDKIRNAISQMASIHFPETEECADRLRAMGIPADSIHTAGALGLSGIALPDSGDTTDSGNCVAPVKQGNSHTVEVAGILAFVKAAPTLIMTLHAETAPDDPSYTLRGATSNLLEALTPLLATHHLVITYPNADIDPTSTIALIKQFTARFPEQVRSIPSLGHKGYIEAVKASVGVIGNSSSGIVEVPSLGVPTLDIGGRQRGRQHGPSVIHSADTDVPSLKAALTRLLSPELKATAARRDNPYYRPDTTRIIAGHLLN